MLLLPLALWAIDALRAATLPRPPLTTAAAVRALSATDAATAMSVRLEGVVLAVPEGPSLVLWDNTDGIYVSRSAAPLGRFTPGDWIAIEGITDAGNFAPMVKADVVRQLGTKPLPTPLHTTIPDVAGGGFDAKWIELEGIVRNCVATTADPDDVDDPATLSNLRAAPRKSSLLTVAAGDVQLRVRVSAILDPAAVVDARVRFRGVCFNVHNTQRQFVRASVFVSSASDLVVLTPPPSDPFSLPLKRAAELLQFNPSGFSNHRVHVRGVVTRHQAGNALWIRDGLRGMQVVSSQAGRVSPGDEVDIAGFVVRGKYSPSLEDAVFRPLASGTPPEPLSIANLAEAIAHEADLVRIDARLRDLRSTPEGLELTLDWETIKLQALLPKAAATDRSRWEPGSLLRLAGICTLAPGPLVPNNGMWLVDGFQILLRDAADVTVLESPPWLNGRRLTQLLGAAAIFLIGGLVILWLHSRRQMAEREVERRMAEAEFAAILGERNRMARDIHDTLAQGLNAVSMQLELAKNNAPQGSNAVLPHVSTAHTIVRSCIAEARESIWNMRSHALEKADLAGALESVLRQMSEGLPISAKVEVIGPRRRLAPQLENDLLRIGQEGISNALKHAAASQLTLRLEYDPGCVRLRIIDDGRGFDVTAAHRTSSRFGLEGIRERVENMTGTLRVGRVAGGQGTELLVEVAAALEKPAPARR